MRHAFLPVTVLFMLGALGPALAWDSSGWGQYGGTTWGSYAGTIGGQGWQYGAAPGPYAPMGTVLNPNQTGSAFHNSYTGGDLFVPPDTRLKGRDRP